jgi:RNA 3'-terminal phosphate cyclase
LIAVIVIDGSEGEGGGQILRTPLPLSLVALAGGGLFRTPKPSLHPTTNGAILFAFLGAPIAYHARSVAEVCGQ